MDTKDVLYTSKDVASIEVLSKNLKPICSGSSIKRVHLTKQDKDYLNTIYDTDIHDSDWQAFIKHFPLSCFNTTEADKVTITFRKTNGHLVPVSQRFQLWTLQQIRDDFDLGQGDINHELEVID